MRRITAVFGVGLFILISFLSNLVSLVRRQGALTSDGDDGEEPVPDISSIAPIAIPFIQQPDDWQVPGYGISLDAKGEPKSGTTWLGKLIPQLALKLCGRPDNPWCKMGGLVETPNDPAPRYEFEMMKRSTREGDGPSLFLHFKGSGKHYIPGMHSPEGNESCSNGGRQHRNFFDERSPCPSTEIPTRASLMACLWDTSPPCLQYMPSLDPAVRRTVVIVRDPRNVVLSERKMRIEFFNQEPTKNMSVDDFVLRRFEVLVSWTHQRWMWHTESVMNATSHVVVYEDLQESHVGLIGLAAFMGLQCSERAALEVWESHRNASSNRDYTSYGLQRGTIQWMNFTMSRLLPEPLALRWGITPTEL